MKRNSKLFAAGFAAGILLTAILRAGDGLGSKVVDTPHNLSVSGPGKVKAATETEVCIFCHAPHTNNPVSPLWNRPAGGRHYTHKVPPPGSGRSAGVPGRDSRLCLSCHDGTVALGTVGSREGPITMMGSQRVAGSSLIGTDLSDDHPFSFPYDDTLLEKNPRLHPADVLARGGLKLHAPEGTIECTTCHDSHDNSRGNFLLAPYDKGVFCLSCHRMEEWSRSAHANSSSSWTVEPPARWGRLSGKSLDDMACQACHRTHNALGVSLGYALEEEENCLVCHDGRMKGVDIRSEISKASAHDPRKSLGIHRMGEGTEAAAHVECSDCHDPHRMMRRGTVGEGELPAALFGVSGADALGEVVAEARSVEQVCFRCHGGNQASFEPAIPRVVTERDLGSAFLSTNGSFHPVLAPGKNPTIPGLLPEYTAGSTISCLDCHNNDQGPGAGGQGPRGPHGSNHAHLLERPYQTHDYTAESPTAYSLCYKCHDREALLGTATGFPDHRIHVVDHQTPCSACHDPHGVVAGGSGDIAGTHLVNFDRTIVGPAPNGILAFRDDGDRKGSCTMSCHGSDHVNKPYGG